MNTATLRLSVSSESYYIGPHHLPKVWDEKPKAATKMVQCIRLYLQCRKIHGPMAPLHHPGPKIMAQVVEMNAISWPGQKNWGTI